MLEVGASPRTIGYAIIAISLDTLRPIVVPSSSKMTKLKELIRMAADKKRTTTSAHKSKY